MSMDRSLKSGGGLSKHRNVLTRAERISKLAAKGDFSMEEGDPLGLPKVANRKIVAAGKSAKKAGQAAEGETAATPDSEGQETSK